MRINNNIMALNSHRVYGINAGNLGRNVERLSSGFRVNRAADDAAGLAISEKMRSQIRGLNQASRNSLDGVSLIQVAEGAFAVAQNIVQRIRELTVQAANDTNQQVDRDMIAAEVWQLSAEVRDIGEFTEFNEKRIFQGNASYPRVSTIIEDRPVEVLRSANPHVLDGLVLQVGANQHQRLQLNMSFRGMYVPGYYEAGLGIFENFSSQLNHIALAMEGRWGFNDVIGQFFNYTGRAITLEEIEEHGEFAGWFADQAEVDADVNARFFEFGEPSQQGWMSLFICHIGSRIIQDMSMARAQLGAYQNRLEYKIQNLDNQAENVSASESRIRDADMAREMTTFTRNNILFQAATAMLAQANALPNTVLQLIG